MADLAGSVSDASPAALGTVCPALRAVPKISKNLVAYLAGLFVVTPYAAGSGDTRAAGLAEAHADVVVKYLKLVSDADYTAYLQRKLVEWYAAAPKSDRRAPAGEEANKEAPDAGEGGRGC